MRKLSLLLALGLLAVTAGAVYLLARPEETRKQAPQRLNFPMTLADDEGVTATVISAPERIVVLAPHLTEFIFAAGGGSKIVGVTAAEVQPPEARVIASVVAPDGVTPDPIRIGELAPDLVVVSGFTGAEWKKQLRSTGTPVLTLDADGVDDAIADMQKLGDLCGLTDASSLLSEIRGKVDSVVGKTRSRQPPRVFVEFLYPPLTGVGPGGFTGDLVKQAGGKLVAPTGVGETFPWTLKELLAADPDLFIAPSTTGGDVEALRSRKGFEQLRAVRGDGVRVISDDSLFSPGPRLAESLETLAEFFHPGLI